MPTVLAWTYKGKDQLDAKNGDVTRQQSAEQLSLTVRDRVPRPHAQSRIVEPIFQCTVLSGVGDLASIYVLKPYGTIRVQYFGKSMRPVGFFDAPDQSSDSKSQ
eukprot:2970124-Prymnesium_polylepis.1